MEKELQDNKLKGGSGMGKESKEIYDKLKKCYECFKNKVDFKPEIALVPVSYTHLTLPTTILV